MPQGARLDEAGNVIWPFCICTEFDCNIEYAGSRGIDCKGDFTKHPCMFLIEHLELNEPNSEEGRGG